MKGAGSLHILVINGSPRGRHSITLQTVRYLEILHPEHQFETLEAASRIHYWEKDFSQAKEKLEQADLLLFSHPVYTFLVPSQLHRFLQLMRDSNAAVAGKIATQITTSKHFYDVTAHRFLGENLLDMGVRVMDGLSADMDDLPTTRGQKEARDFFAYLMWQIRQGLVPPVPEPGPALQSQHRSVTVPGSSVPRREGRVVIVADLAPEDLQLKAMIDRFQAVLPLESTVVNLREFPFRGGCLGCLQCATDGTCVYKDGFSELLREKIQTGDAIVSAFSIQEHSRGYRFRLYDDRQFCNGHRAVTAGTPTGHLVSGDLSREENLRFVLEAQAQVGGNFLAGIATDETDPDREISELAARLTWAVRNHYRPPANYYGVGGNRIFRDLIWQMQGFMKADHQFYRSRGQYDFPQNKPGTILKMYLVGGLMSVPALKAHMRSGLDEGMVAPYQKVLAKAERTMRRRKNAASSGVEAE